MKQKLERREFGCVDLYRSYGTAYTSEGIQRIRYYGLQATKTYEKWSQVIKEGLKNFCKAVQGVYEVIESRNYRQRYKESRGKDPLKCPFCGVK